VQVGNEWSHDHIYIYVNISTRARTHTHTHMQGSPVIIQSPKNWILIGRRFTTPKPELYNPAVFLRYLRLTAFPFPQGKIRPALQKDYLCKNCVTENCLYSTEYT